MDFGLSNKFCALIPRYCYSNFNPFKDSISGEKCTCAIQYIVCIDERSMFDHYSENIPFGQALKDANKPLEMGSFFLEKQTAACIESDISS